MSDDADHTEDHSWVCQECFGGAVILGQIGRNLSVIMLGETYALVNDRGHPRHLLIEFRDEASNRP